MSKQSAGILLYKLDKTLQVFLVHPGGPFWKNKDAGAWTIPKGEFTDEEKALDAARREFEEETGTKLSGDFIELTPIKQKGGKVVYAWAIQGEINASKIKCQTIVEMEYPPKTGKLISFPEVDRGEWFTADAGKQKINSSQAALIDELIEKIIG
jgi:predicted NUDIX family NTP pyrophosphohydrolase